MKSNTMKAIITIAGLGIGVFNMLASQLGKTRERGETELISVMSGQAR